MSTWHDHPRSSTMPLIPGYALTVNATPDHKGPVRWRARAIGQPVDGEWDTRDEAKAAVFKAFRYRLAALIYTLGDAQ